MSIHGMFELFRDYFGFTNAKLELRLSESGRTALENAVRNCKGVLVEELLRSRSSWDIGTFPD